MHGRLKVRTTAEQEQRKKLEREKKLEFYKLAMNSCLDRIKAKNYSLDGIKLSDEVLANNGDVQSLWNFRKNIIQNYENNQNQQSENDEQFRKEMINLLKAELNVTEFALKKNPKSYGSWYHRQWCLTKAHNLNLSTDSPELSWKHELELCNLFLNSDERNFHCWKHRYFVVKNGNLSRLDELNYTFEKISSNFSNYSSWHYRSKLIEALHSENQIDADIFKNELNLIENAVFTDPNDQSAWIYEKWLLQEHQRSFIKQITFDIKSSCLKFKFAQETNLNNNLLHLKLNDVYVGFDIDNFTEIDKDSFIWEINLCNIKDEQTNEKMGHLTKALTKQDHMRIEIIVKNSGVSNDFILNKNKTNQSIFEFKSRFDMKNINLDHDLIEGHLKNVLELSKLENDKSKWCLLKSIELMCIDEFGKYKQTIFNNLDKLANEIDPYRKNYYLDLKQRIVSSY
jgi:geranylgeranyl transferase type-2 subunit alpha